jgi:hypothetical protein
MDNILKSEQASKYLDFTQFNSEPELFEVIAMNYIKLGLFAIILSKL